MSRTLLRRGQVLRDTYVLEEPLEGSKTAYKATHRGLKTALVVELYADESGLEQLDHAARRERQNEVDRRQKRLERFAALSHPGLSRVIDTFEHEGRRFLVREWVEGYTLRKLVEGSLRPLTQDTAAGFRDQLLDLLGVLNELDPPLVLGTLCPDYIAVSPDGRLRVIDYGLACHRPGKKEFEPFSSPEALSGAELVCGLRVAGEFRDFRLILDDWRRSWSLECFGGKISTEAGESRGRSGLFLEVRYQGRGAERARQAADELVRLVRRTRLCPVPITIGKKPLEPGRGVEVMDSPKTLWSSIWSRPAFRRREASRWFKLRERRPVRTAPSPLLSLARRRRPSPTWMCAATSLRGSRAWARLPSSATTS